MAEKYRFGFNGKEADPKWMGAGVAIDYGFRVHDARVSRFLSVDPLAPEYPWYTPYQFAGNMPVWAIDLDGLEPQSLLNKDGSLSEPVIQLLNAAYMWDINILRNSRWVVDPNRAKEEYAGTSILHRNTVYFKSPNMYGTKENRTHFAKWLNTIAHEEKHRQDLYGFALENPYVFFERPIPERQKTLEKRAYLYGTNEGTAPLLKGVLEKLNEHFEIVKEDVPREVKIGFFRLVGLDFRKEMLEHAISHLGQKTQNLEKKLKDQKQSNHDRVEAMVFLIENNRLLKKLHEKLDETKKEIETIERYGKKKYPQYFE